MTMNPADEAAENYKNEMDKLRAEVCINKNHICRKTISHKLYSVD